MIAAFGKLPKGKSLERIQQAPNYTDKAFQNLSHTPMMAEDSSYFKVIKEVMRKPKTAIPAHTLPSVTTNLNTLPNEEPVVVWFGHSSYLLKINNQHILVDPVFSGNASPVSFMLPAFKGSNTYGVADMPHIDVLVITHDHYDHLDYKTVRQLHKKVSHVICSIGVAAHLIYWGYNAANITELYWGESATVGNNLNFTAASARHFSGRGLVRNKSLWSSFILSSDNYKIYIGGDSGYDKHFKEIGETYGPFDLAILECGQYNHAWKYIHMLPEETVQATVELKAKVLFPVHWGKFSLSLHPWNESVTRAHAHATTLGVNITSPKIGEILQVNGPLHLEKWWAHNT